MRVTSKQLERILKNIENAGINISNVDFEISPMLGIINGQKVLGRYVRKEIRIQKKDKPLVQIIQKGIIDLSELRFVILHELGHHDHWSNMLDWSKSSTKLQRENHADNYAANLIPVVSFK